MLYSRDTSAKLTDAHGSWCAWCFEYFDSELSQEHHLLENTSYHRLKVGDFGWSTINIDWSVPVHANNEMNPRPCHPSMDDNSGIAFRNLEGDLAKDSNSIKAWATEAHAEGHLRKSVMFRWHLRTRNPDDSQNLHFLLVSLSGTTIDPRPMFFRLKKQLFQWIVKAAPKEPLMNIGWYDGWTPILCNLGYHELAGHTVHEAMRNMAKISRADQRNFRANLPRRFMMILDKSAKQDEAMASAKEVNNLYSLMTIAQLEARKGIHTDPWRSLRLLESFPWSESDSWWQYAVYLFNRSCSNISISVRNRDWNQARSIARDLTVSDFILRMLGLRPMPMYNPFNVIDTPALFWPSDLLVQLQKVRPDELSKDYMKSERSNWLHQTKEILLQQIQFPFKLRGVSLESVRRNLNL